MINELCNYDICIKYLKCMFLLFFIYIDAPRLTMSCTPNKVYEGYSATLCCSSYSRPATIDLWLENIILSSTKHTRVLCHKIVNASRYNSGVYRCYAKDNFGIVNAEVNLMVLCKSVFSVVVY